MISSFGVQLWTVRDYLNTPEQVRETFRKIKAMGYDEIQTAGCIIPYETFGAIAQEEGLTICGTHDDFGMMLQHPDEAMQNHRLLGTVNMGVGGRTYENGLADVQEYIAQVKQVAAQIKPYGFNFTYHHHSHEFIKCGDTTIFDELVNALTEDNIRFVLDTYWLQHGGADVRYWIQALAGRVDILHLKDMARDENGPMITEIGNGNLWWDGILDTAVKAGVSHFIVEQDVCPGDPFDSLEQSIRYLNRFRG